MALAAGPMLRTRDITVLVDDYIERVAFGSEHRGEVRVLGEHDLARSRGFFNILTDLLLGLSDIDRQHNKVTRELMDDGIDRRLIAAAVPAPGRPELKKNELPFEDIVVEFLAVEGDCSEPRRPFTRIQREKSATGGGGKQGFKSRPAVNSTL